VAQKAWQAHIMWEEIIKWADGTPFQKLIEKAIERPYPKIVIAFRIGNRTYRSTLEFMSVADDATGIFSWRGDKINIEDIRYGQELGYVVKLLAIGIKEQDGISVRVHPAFISKNDPLALVSGPFNAVSVYGNAVGHTMFYGRGAGRMPTASAVVADVIDIILGNAGRTFDQLAVLPDTTAPATLKPMAEISSRYYLRLMVVDRPGVLAKLTDIFGRNFISISALLQHEGATYDKNGEPIVPVVILTHRAKEGNLQAAFEEIAKLEASAEKPFCIRVVDEHPEWQ
jgi:homoserine dehydrogenase